MKEILITILMISLNTKVSTAQNTRLNDYNTIGWISNTTTIKIKGKWSAHVEYQWRRVDALKNWQQGLARCGINYQANDKVQFRAGYASAITYPYGDYTLQAAGKVFTENRIFEVVTITDKIKRVGLMHRFMLEQRWIGRYTNPSLEKTDATTYLNRMRYMIRVQHAISNKEINDHTLYVAAFDEVFIGFGENVGENIFDQNRLSLLLGYRFNSTVRIEGGFLSQIVQLGREINGANVLQYNNGFLVSGFYNL